MQFDSKLNPNANEFIPIGLTSEEIAGYDVFMSSLKEIINNIDKEEEEFEYMIHVQDEQNELSSEGLETVEELKKFQDEVSRLVDDPFTDAINHSELKGKATQEELDEVARIYQKIW